MQIQQLPHFIFPLWSHTDCCRQRDDGLKSLCSSCNFPRIHMKCSWFIYKELSYVWRRPTASMRHLSNKNKKDNNTTSEPFPPTHLKALLSSVDFSCSTFEGSSRSSPPCSTTWQVKSEKPTLTPDLWRWVSPPAIPFSWSPVSNLKRLSKACILLKISSAGRSSNSGLLRRQTNARSCPKAPHSDFAHSCRKG